MSALFRHLNKMNDIVFSSGATLTHDQYTNLVASFYIYRNAYNRNKLTFFWSVDFAAHNCVSYVSNVFECIVKTLLRTFCFQVLRTTHGAKTRSCGSSETKCIWPGLKALAHSIRLHDASSNKRFLPSDIRLRAEHLVVDQSLWVNPRTVMCTSDEET